MPLPVLVPVLVPVLLLALLVLHLLGNPGRGCWGRRWSYTFAKAPSRATRKLT